MKLSKDQIDYLKDLISSKGHMYIDVQYEILDHVASKMEALMGEDQNLPLEQAFQKVFASFGYKGFNELDESYQKMIRKRHRDYFWEELKSLLMSFRSLFIIGVFGIFYQMRFIFDTASGWVGGLLLLFIISACVLAIFHWGKFRRYRKYAAFQNSGNFFSIIVVVYQICSVCYILLNNTPNNNEMLKQISLMLVIGIIAILFCCLFVLPKVFERSQADTERLIKLYQMN